MWRVKSVILDFWWSRSWLRFLSGWLPQNKGEWVYFQKIMVHFRGQDPQLFKNLIDFLRSRLAFLWSWRLFYLSPLPFYLNFYFYSDFFSLPPSSLSLFLRPCINIWASSFNQKKNQPHNNTSKYQVTTTTQSRGNPLKSRDQPPLYYQKSTFNTPLHPHF